LKFYCPINLDLVKSLEDAAARYWAKHLWKLYYIITVIYRARWNRASEEDAFAPINAKFLENAIGTRFACPAKEVLLKIGIIETDNHYEVGLKSKGYRFREPYKNERFREVKMALPQRAVVRLETLPKLRIQTEKLEHFFLKDNLLKLTVDPGVVRFFTTFNARSDRQWDYYQRSVEFILTRQWLFCYDEKTGRVFNNVTSLPKQLRPFLRLQGRSLVEIDVANCQPFLLLGLYNGNPRELTIRGLLKTGSFMNRWTENLNTHSALIGGKN
jgi:hypothetical protein